MKKILYGLLKSAARLYLKKYTPYIIGITGSVGKTSCRMILSQTLQKTLVSTVVSTSPKNFNSEIGLCLSILEIKKRSTNPISVIFTLCLARSRALFSRKRYDVLVAEYGIDNQGDMDYLLSIAVPNIAVFTVLDKVHAMQMGSPDEILEEKSKLLKAAKEIVFVSVPSTVYLKKTLDQLSCDVLSYATHPEEVENADIRRRNRVISKDKKGLPMAQFIIEQGNESVTSLSTNLLGATDAGYISLGIECAQIIAIRLQKEYVDMSTLDHISYALQPGRMTIFEGKRGSILVDSSYNAAPKSVKETISTVIGLRNEIYPDYRLVYCLGDMRELGDFSEPEHRTLAGFASQSADAIYLVGAEMKKYMMDELTKIGYNMDNVFWFESSTDLGKALDEDFPGEEKRAVVLFKGSQNTIFLEEGVKQMLHKENDKKKLPRQGSFWRGKKIMSILILCFSLILVGCSHPSTTNETGKRGVVEPLSQVCFEQNCFEVEIADQPREHQKGLMGRELMDQDKGMLFIFKDNRTHNFWMKNTLIPLDMIWMDSDGIILHIEKDVQPCPPTADSCPSYGPEQGVVTDYVLELNAGVSERLGIDVGDELIISKE